MIIKRNLLTKVSIMAIAALMIGAFVVTVPMSTDASFSGEGSVTVADTYEITTVEQLQAMNQNLSAHYVLKGFIDAGDVLFTPVGNQTNPFTGSFDGSNGWIINLTIESSGDNVGLFGFTGAGAVIKKVNLQMINVDGNDNVGGLVGTNNGNISESLVTGSVNGSENVGGLVGINNGNVTDSFSRAQVKGLSIVGGLIGYNGANGDINRTYAAGLVNATGGSAGGLIGLNNGDVSSSFWDVQTTGQATSAGEGVGNAEGKSTEDMYNRTTFSDAGWDFVNIWRIDDGEHYPELQVHFTIEELLRFFEKFFDEVCNSAGVILFIGGVAIISSRKKKS